MALPDLAYAAISSFDRQSYTLTASASVSSTCSAAPHGLQGLQAEAAHGLQGLQAFFAAQGLHGLHAFLAAQGLHGLHALFAAQGLHGLRAFLAAHGLAFAADCKRGTTQALLVAPPPAAQGLHGLQGFFAAQGLHGLHAFLAAHGLHGLQAAAHGFVFFTAQGLHGLHVAANAGAIVMALDNATPPALTPATIISGTTVVDKRILFRDSIFTSLTVVHMSIQSDGVPNPVMLLARIKRFVSTVVLGMFLRRITASHDSVKNRPIMPQSIN